MKQIVSGVAIESAGTLYQVPFDSTKGQLTRTAASGLEKLIKEMGEDFDAFYYKVFELVPQANRFDEIPLLKVIEALKATLPQESVRELQGFLPESDLHDIKASGGDAGVVLETKGDLFQVSLDSKTGQAAQNVGTVLAGYFEKMEADPARQEAFQNKLSELAPDGGHGSPDLPISAVVAALKEVFPEVVVKELKALPQPPSDNTYR